ncbi:hypothetical protein PIB30_055842 [Stylosanthes scabra]|uniref:Uncharacterized protein n=1 Tax=Stylosanthes scabra TaxID=79078 RepID=A0ABU6ZHW6_9FABA|nr:hypothetical protein [Stylosanthes scabra]
MRYDQILQEAAAQQAREANKGKAREIVPDSEEEDSEELASSASEECAIVQGKRLGKPTLYVSSPASYVKNQIHKANLDRASTLYVEDHTPYVGA